jgi:PAS domain S-box-containing protein
MTGLAAALTGALIWAVTSNQCDRLHQEARVRVAALAATIASGVAADGITMLSQPGGDATPEAIALRSSLIDARQANPEVRRIYILTPGRMPGTWRFAIESVASHGDRARSGAAFQIGDRIQIEEARTGPTADFAPVPDPGGGSWIGGYAPVRNRDGRTVAVLAVEVAADAAMAAKRRFLLEAWIVFAILLGGIAFTGLDRYRKRRLEMERNRNIHARLSIHRLAEVMTRAGSESDLIRNALYTMAVATGFTRWALFRKDRERGPFVLAATRGFDGKSAALDPEATGHGLCSVPLLEDGEPTGTLQCFAEAGRGFETDDITLIRWLAAQLTQGLKRIQLESRDQLLASYMRSTDELLIGFDLDGKTTYANPAACRALGDAGDELRGRSLDAMFTFSAEDRSASLLALLRGEGGFSGDLHCHTLEGATFPGEATISKATDREGQESAWVLVGRDISERREREIEIQSRSEQLELINDQLQHANERLAEGSRMKNEFLANTSHELRTPLNAVIGFATLLEQNITESEEERNAFARSIRESAEHLLTVINDILDLAKVEAGKLELALETEDAIPTIHAAAEAMRPAATRKGIELTVTVPPEPLEMQLDPARLRQVLLNLLGNSIKFTDKGAVDVLASRRHDEVVIVVRDTGVGIAKEDQARLFVKFSQVDGSFKRRHQGAGLGLVITKSLVQRMGGRISMESEGLGLGTRVTIAFPAAVHEETTSRGAHA